MRERYIAPTIMLAAGAITSVLNIVNHIDLLESLKRLLIVLIVFFIIGQIATKIILKSTHIDNAIETDEPIQTSDDQLSENEANKTEE